MFPATITPEANWAAVVKTEEDVLQYAHSSSPLQFVGRQQHFPAGPFCARGYKEERQLPFFRENDSNRAIEATVGCQLPLLNSTISSSESGSCSKLFPSGGTLTQALDSDCALSLLSSPARTSSINLIGHMLPAADRIPMGQPLVSGLHHPYGGQLPHYAHSHQASNAVSSTGFSCSGAEEDEQVGTVLVSDAGDVDIHCQGIFQLGVDGTSGGASQAIPFSWQ